MKTNKKLSLENLNVKSFVTNLNEKEEKTVQGGVTVLNCTAILMCSGTKHDNMSTLNYSDMHATCGNTFTIAQTAVVC